MVRRAALEADAPPDESGQGGADHAPPGAAAAAPRAAQPWRGAGGRWLVWTLRAVVWAILLIVGYRGVAAIATGWNQTSARQPGASGPSLAGQAAASDSGFPSGLAESYALEFGQIYLSFSPATAAQRARELAAFLPPGADPQLGWNGAGSQRVASVQVASVTADGAHRGTVTLLARVNDRLMELGVPVYMAHGGMVIAGKPAWLPPPARISPPPEPVGTDSPAVTALTSQLPAFFRAYASGDRVTLNRFAVPGTAVPGAVVTSLNGAVMFGSLAGITVPAGGSTRIITVSVKWLIPGTSGARGPVASAPAGLEMTYQMTVVRKGATWYVRAIGPAAQQPGPP